MTFVIEPVPAGTSIWLNTNIAVSRPPQPPNGEPALKVFESVEKPTAAFGGYVLKAKTRRQGTANNDNSYVHFYWNTPKTAGMFEPRGPVVKISPDDANPVIASSNTAIAHFKINWANDAHYCIQVAITVGSGEPQSHTPNHVDIAQRNFSPVVAKSGTKMFMMGFEIGVPFEEQDGEYTVEMVQDTVEELEKIKGLFAPDLKLQSLEGRINNFGILPYNPCLNSTGLHRARPVLEGVTEEKYRGRGVMLAGVLEGDAALVHIIQRRRDGEIVGGLTALVHEPVKERPRKDYSAS